MHAEASSSLGDVNHTINEGRNFLGQGRELVHHNQQARWSPWNTVLLHLHQILHPMLIEDHLASMQLGMQRNQRTLDHRRGEVRDHADGMSQPLPHQVSLIVELIDKLTERGSALVVDQQERDSLRAVGGR